MNRALGAILIALLLASCRQEAQAPVVANGARAEAPSLGNVVLGNMELPAENAAAASFPALTGRVVDNAELLTPRQEAALGARSEALERQTTDQLVIATLPSLGGQSIEQYTRALGNHWGIGQRDRNNGVLMVVALNERRVRIAVGDGLVTTLPNEETQRIVDGMIPAFRESRWFDGIDGASRAISARLSARSAR